MIYNSRVEFFKQKIVEEFQDNSHYFNQVNTDVNRFVQISYNSRSGVCCYIDKVKDRVDPIYLSKKDHPEEFGEIVQFLKLICEVDSL